VKKYEMVREIYNNCSRNAMRDIFFQEIELEDPLEYVREVSKGENVQIEAQRLESGELIVDVNIAGQAQRYTFTEV
jgi:hypothetical protein